jgi:RimJ/RimL family protein N-acetyltransferase
MTQPVLESDRLLLRPFVKRDAAEVSRLAGNPRIADMATEIPHPYPADIAQAWIATHAEEYQAGHSAIYAVMLREPAIMIGAVALLDISLVDARAELGYWIGVDYWSQGYCTEAAARLIRFAHDELHITRIVACCLARNPASTRVLAKLAMQPEGRLSRHVHKHGVFEDVLLSGLNLPDRISYG